MLIRCTEQVYNFPFRSCISRGKKSSATFVNIQYTHFCFCCLFVSLLANIDKYLKSAMFFLNKKGINFTLKKCLKWPMKKDLVGPMYKLMCTHRGPCTPSGRYTGHPGSPGTPVGWGSTAWGRCIPWSSDSCLGSQSTLYSHPDVPSLRKGSWYTECQLRLNINCMSLSSDYLNVINCINSSLKT